MSITPHPSLPEFDYIHPTTAAEASDFLAHHPDDARPFLGGTDLLVRMRDGFLHPRYLVDIKHLDGVSSLHFNPGTEGIFEPGLTIGAAVNMNTVIASPEVQAYYPLLAEACRSVASYQLRTRATLAGNLCNASPAGDTIGACLVFQGMLSVYGIQGLRQERLSTFFLGPGKTRLQPGDIVTSLHFPLPPPGSKGIYLKLGRNQLSDLAIVGVTVLGYPDSSSISGFRFRIALASVAPVPLLASQAEIYLAEHALSPETLHQAARLAAEACSPIDDVRGSARYRRAMVRNLTHQGLETVSRQLSQTIPLQ
jgi:aerobic carbon-monoxide dehydrogenase medium subunit